MVIEPLAARFGEARPAVVEMRPITITASRCLSGCSVRASGAADSRSGLRSKTYPTYWRLATRRGEGGRAELAQYLKL